MRPALSEIRPIIAIGDVHGCLLSLKKLIKLINPEPDDQLVFLGDVIDRGDRSKEVVNYLIELDSSRSCHFLMGNHELMFLDYLENQESTEWLANGGEAMLKSYNNSKELDFPNEHIAFLKSFHFFIETENYFFTHGGLDPELSIKNNLLYYQPQDFCFQRIHMRPEFINSNTYNWEKTLVCAHTPVSNPVISERLIAIDTGCVYKDNPLLGNLTAIILPERRIIQTRNID